MPTIELIDFDICRGADRYCGERERLQLIAENAKNQFITS
jgi:hypothetical protein